MVRVLILPLFLFFVQSLCAQIKSFDKLEMLYDQQHFKLVLRKSKHLLDKPECDYSPLPRYYKAMSLFRLVQDDRWYSRHPQGLLEATTDMKLVMASSRANELSTSRKYEIRELKADLYAWGEELSARGQVEDVAFLKNLLLEVFAEVENIQEDNTGPKPILAVGSGPRYEVVQRAKSQLGIPYLWAGNSPKGFDCSGFTSYVYQVVGLTLERRAADQYLKGTKVKKAKIEMGDLIFFSNGKGISHVGIVISNPDESLHMIHSSSSKGIVVTNVDESSYWSKRVYGYCSYF
jgi:hypothetical protein